MIARVLFANVQIQVCPIRRFSLSSLYLSPDEAGEQQFECDFLAHTHAQISNHWEGSLCAFEYVAVSTQTYTATMRSTAWIPIEQRIGTASRLRITRGFNVPGALLSSASC